MEDGKPKVTDSSWTYHWELRLWTALKSMPEPRSGLKRKKKWGEYQQYPSGFYNRYGHSCLGYATTNDHSIILVVGGVNDERKFARNSVYYNFSSDTWKDGPTLDRGIPD